MVRASSRLLFLLTNPIIPRHQRPIAIFRLAHLHSPAFSLPTPWTTAPNPALHISRSSSLIPIKFSQSFYSRAPNPALHISRSSSLIPIKFSQSFYSRATNDRTHFPANDYQASPSHPWPEWSRLLESLSYAGYFNWSSNIEDEFVANQNLSMEFFSAANACLAFARDRPDILGWLPRKDIELLITDGYPYLFKNAHETERRMRSFLQSEGSNEARSVDLMKYILSYASNPIIYPERNIREATESSVRNLLQQMVNLNSRSRSSEQYQEQIPRNLGPNITMKKGDWICPKCSFMNFARNTKCLECEQPKPPGNPIPYERVQNYQNAPHSLTTNNNNSNYVQLQDTNKEEKVERWFKKIKELHSVTTSNTHVNNNQKTEIPFPFPSKPQQQNSTTFPPPFVPFPSDHISKKDNLGIGNLECKSSFENNMGKSLEGSEVRERDGLDMSEEAKAERWFRRVAQIKDISELSEIPDEDFPAIMPMRKGVNRFVVSKRKTPLERRLTSPQYRKNLRVMSSERNRDGDDDE